MRKLFISIISFVFALSLVALQVGYGIAKEDLQGKVLATNEVEENIETSGTILTGMLPDSNEGKETGVLTSKDFIIEIPRINLKKEVEPNVDPRDKNIYGPVIEEKIAHGMFTKFPDETEDKGKGNVYLFAHRDGPHGFFNRLGELETGDTINLTFLGKTYVYEVNTSFIVDPDATYVYTGQSDTPTLTLQTCNNGIKERLILKADLIEVL